MSALNLARYILTLEDANEPDITHMKLQKLLYFAQGHYLAFVGKPLFDDDIQAWKYGPVVPAVYEEFSECGKNIITKFEKPTGITPEIASFLSDIFKVYGRHTSAKLSELTHKEGPWKSKKEHYSSITKEELKKFFSTKKNEFASALEELEDRQFLESYEKSSVSELVPNSEVWKKHSC